MSPADNPKSAVFVDDAKSTAAGALARALMHSVSGGVVYGLQDDTVPQDKIVTRRWREAVNVDHARQSAGEKPRLRTKVDQGGVRNRT